MDEMTDKTNEKSPLINLKFITLERSQKGKKEQRKRKRTKPHINVMAGPIVNNVNESLIKA